MLLFILRCCTWNAFFLSASFLFNSSEDLPSKGAGVFTTTGGNEGMLHALTNNEGVVLELSLTKLADAGLGAVQRPAIKVVPAKARARIIDVNFDMIKTTSA
jgi:hypothetical protein